MSGTGLSTRVATMAERVILGVIAGAALAIGAIEAVWVVMRTVVTLSGGPATVSVPLTDAPATAALDAEGVTDAVYDSVSLTLSSVPESARAMTVAADALSSLIPIGVCAVLVWLCVRVLVGRPFVRSVTWSIGGVSILVLCGGLGGSAGRAVANAEIAAALELDGTALPTLLAEVSLAPLGWAMALAVVAAAFEIGQRMQRETEGLV